MKTIWFSAVTLIAMLVGDPVAAQPTRPLGPTLTRIQETEVITLGHRLSSAPFSFLDDQGVPRGYSIDLCLEIVDEVKQHLGLETLDIQYVQMDTTTRIPLVRNGTIDLGCGSATNNLTRQEEVDYTHITYVTGVRLLVKSTSGIENIRSMSDQSIGVSPNTTTEKVIQTVLERESIEATLYNQIQDHDEGFVALESGLIDAYATDDVLLFGLKSRANDPNGYEVVGEFLSYEPYGIMLRRDDSAFRLVANRRLSALFRTGEIRPIFEHWFLPLGIPLGATISDAFRLQALPE